jgi:hypothetical protein
LPGEVGSVVRQPSFTFYQKLITINITVEDGKFDTSQKIAKAHNAANPRAR